MEPPNEEFIVMNEEAIKYLGLIMENTSINKSYATKLKTNWENLNIIEIDALYDDVINNALLMRTMQKHLANGLPKTVEKSNYSPPYTSDHNLYFNGSTDIKLNELLKRLNISLSHDDFVKLAKRRNALYQSVRNTKKTAIDDMEFIGQ
jgi:hypothetical protein